MKKTIGIFALLSLVLTLSFTKSRSIKQEGAGITFKHISLEDAKKQAEKTGKLIFIDAYTSWCGPCKVVAPVVDELKKKYEGKVGIHKVDVDENQDLAKEYGIK